MFAANVQIYVPCLDFLLFLFIIIGGPALTKQPSSISKVGNVSFHSRLMTYMIGSSFTYFMLILDVIYHRHSWYLTQCTMQPDYYWS